MELLGLVLLGGDWGAGPQRERLRTWGVQMFAFPGSRGIPGKLFAGAIGPYGTGVCEDLRVWPRGTSTGLLPWTPLSNSGRPAPPKGLSPTVRALWPEVEGLPQKEGPGGLVSPQGRVLGATPCPPDPGTRVLGAVMIWNPQSPSRGGKNTVPPPGVEAGGGRCPCCPWSRPFCRAATGRAAASRLASAWVARALGAVSEQFSEVWSRVCLVVAEARFPGGSWRGCTLTQH